VVVVVAALMASLCCTHSHAHNLTPSSNQPTAPTNTDYGGKLEDPANLGAALTGNGLGKL
jgi:hypothetical protein